MSAMAELDAQRTTGYRVIPAYLVAEDDVLGAFKTYTQVNFVQRHDGVVVMHVHGVGRWTVPYDEPIAVWYDPGVRYLDLARSERKQS